jgi:ATP phosphoribosyltransferase regulatory subunit
MNNALLPSGLMDTLPPHSAQEFRLIHRFLKHFMAFGYEPVTPPLLEHAETMLSGLSEEAATRYFQVTDGQTGRMLALRADITSQIARIAATTLAGNPRPLRLCYAGPRVCTVAPALQSRRQHMQIGIEYIGATDAQAEAETIAIACHALAQLELGELTVDISYPPLVKTLLAMQPAATREALRDAVANKNLPRIRSLHAELVAQILELPSNIGEALQLLRTLPHPEIAPFVESLEKLVQALAQKKITASWNLDVLEHYEADYYTGFAFAIFSGNPALELARGGRYRTHEEDAVGFTLYIDDLLAHLPGEALSPIVALPHGTSCEEAAKIQQKAYRTVFTDIDDAATLAKHNIGLIWRDGKITVAT